MRMRRLYRWLFGKLWCSWRGHVWDGQFYWHVDEDWPRHEWLVTRCDACSHETWHEVYAFDRDTEEDGMGYAEMDEMAEVQGHRTFDTGANRDAEDGKHDYEGFLSPIVIERFGQYMHKHRHLADGTLRASDNWQKGIPADVYMKSAWRHFLDLWMHHRGYAVAPDRDQDIEEALCGLMFNTMGYMHEVLVGRADVGADALTTEDVDDLLQGIYEDVEAGSLAPDVGVFAAAMGHLDLGDLPLAPILDGDEVVGYRCYCDMFEERPHEPHLRRWDFMADTPQDGPRQYVIKDDGTQAWAD